MRFLITASAFLLAVSSASAADEPAWPKKHQVRAAKYLDKRADFWRTEGGKILATPLAGRADHTVRCLCCHTTFPYALARPALRASLKNDDPLAGRAATPLSKLLTDTSERLQSWEKHTVMYRGPKTKQSRGTEAILSALMLASNDAADGRATPRDLTRQAFSILWSTQLPTGEWHWLDFSLQPWESAEAQYFGAALAAWAMGTAPGYVPSDEEKAKRKMLIAYLTDADRFKKQRVYNKLWLLLASSKTDGLLTKEQRDTIIEALKKKQKTVDGKKTGWALVDLMPDDHERAGLNAATKKADGYATGLIAYALLKSGVSKKDAAVSAALQWLVNTQDADGSWHTASINKDRAPGSFAYPFMTDAATAYASLALLAAEAK